MYPEDYPFYLNPIIEQHVYEKYTDEELESAKKTGCIVMISVLGTIFFSGIGIGVLHLLKII